MKPILREANPAAEAGRAHARLVDAYIISAGETLLLELGLAVGERFRTRPIDDIQALPARGQTPWIGFVDGNHDDARRWIEHIGAAHPQAALIVIVDSPELPAWQDMVGGGFVCAVLGSWQINTAAFAGALARAQRYLQKPLMASPPVDPTPQRGAGLQWILTALGGTAAATLALVWYLLSGQPSKSPDSMSAGVVTPVASQVR